MSDKTSYDSDIPPEVEYLMSLFETAVTYRWYEEQHCDEPVLHFIKGVVDYSWKDPEETVEPHFGMLFDRPVEPDEQWRGCVSRQGIHYQKGAIIGYRLEQEYELRPSQKV